MKQYWPQDKLENLIWAKIGAQWKNIREAYQNIQGGQLGAISKDHLKNCLQKWSFDLTDD